MAAVYAGSPRIYGRATPLLYCPTHPRRFLFLASLFFSSASFPHVSPIRAATRADRIAASRRLSNRKPDAGDRESSSPKDDFVVASFYKFVLLEDPEAQVTKHLAFLQGLDIHGRIYVNEQGINAQYSGPYKDALAYADWVKEDDKFSDILVQTSPAFSGHAFPRLKLRYKPSLVQVEGGVSHLPLVDATMRASLLTPSEWRKRLQAMSNVGTSTKGAVSEGSERNCLLLDVRNGYEWDVGHFEGAQRPHVDCFRRTSFGMLEDSEPEVTPPPLEILHGKSLREMGELRVKFGEMRANKIGPPPSSNDYEARCDPLSGIDKENTDILMYCTGGIRCDVYSTILRQKGFQNLYTLSGGISNYLKNEGPAEWVGNLFVFDGRLSLPPATLKPDASINAYVRPKIVHENSSFARCYVCGSKLHEFRHRNCANLDCNRLFLSCSSCVTQLSGCCCVDCTSAPRLRPVLPGHQRYQKWHIYRDGDLLSGC